MPVPAPEYELAQFFDFSRDLFCIAGFDGYYKLVNASFERVLGYSREELMSRPFMEIVHPDDVERAHDVLAVLATGEDVVGFESRLICADGSARRFEWNTRTMPHLGVVYGIARDVTVRTALAEEQAALRRVATLVARERPPEEGFASVAKELGRVLGERADRGAHARCGYRLGRRRADRRRGADLARDDRGNEGVRSVAHRHRRSASPLARCTTTISARSPRTLMRRLSPGSRTQTGGGQRDRKG
jgi:PAS domain S-box-containing protein